MSMGSASAETPITLSCQGCNPCTQARPVASVTATSRWLSRMPTPGMPSTSICAATPSPSARPATGMPPSQITPPLAVARTAVSLVLPTRAACSSTRPASPSQLTAPSARAWPVPACTRQPGPPVTGSCRCACTASVLSGPLWARTAAVVSRSSWRVSIMATLQRASRCNALKPMCQSALMRRCTEAVSTRVRRPVAPVCQMPPADQLVRPEVQPPNSAVRRAGARLPSSWRKCSSALSILKLRWYWRVMRSSARRRLCPLPTPSAWLSAVCPLSTPHCAGIQ